MIRKAIVLFLHEEFICRFLKSNGYVLRDGSCVYCKESTTMFRLLDKIRREINNVLSVCPEAGKVYMYPETWHQYL